MSDQIFYLFSAVLLGLVVGALIMYFASGSNKDSEQTIYKLQKELENYQKNVAEHFEETADLVDGMTQSYKKVFDHLGKSARKLMTEEQIQQQLELRRGNKVTLEYLTETSEDEIIENPEVVQEPSEETNDVSNISESKAEEVSIDDDTNQSKEVELVDDSNHEKTELVEDSNQQENKEHLVDNEPESNSDSSKELEKEVETREKNIYS